MTELVKEFDVTNNSPLCTAPGCDHPLHSRGWCNMHYKRMRDIGNLELAPKPTLAERFWSKVDQTGDCWLWTGATDPQGYGRSNGPQTLAHRVAYELTTGSQPPLLDHICLTPACVRPAHLRPVTPKQNGENRSGPTRANTSGALGVTRNHGKTWRAQVTHNGELHWGGCYSTVAEAEAAAVALRLRLYTHNELDRSRVPIERTP